MESGVLPPYSLSRMTHIYCGTATCPQKAVPCVQLWCAQMVRHVKNQPRYKNRDEML